MSYNTLIKAGQNFITDENGKDWTAEKNFLRQLHRKPGQTANKINLNSEGVEGTKSDKPAMEQQEVLASQCIQHLPAFCQREIESITKNHPALCPKIVAEILEQLHQELVKLCKYLLAAGEIATGAVPKITTVIQATCETIQNAYLEDLQLKQAQVQRLVKQCKSKYEVDMGSFIKSDQFLENNFTEDAYNDQHIHLKQQATKTFTKNMVSELGEDEPVSKHIETLNHYLEKSKMMFRKKVEVGRPLPKGPNQMTNATPSKSTILTCSAEPTGKVVSTVVPNVKFTGPANDSQTTPCSVPINTSTPKIAMLAAGRSAKPKESLENARATPSESTIPTCSVEPTREMVSKVEPNTKFLAPANVHPPTPCSAPINTGTPKNALLVQLTKDKIGLAVTEYTDGKYTWRPIHEKLFVPFAVALSSNNDWHYGMDIKSNPSNENLSKHQLRKGSTPSGSLYQGEWKISSYFALPFSKTGSADTIKCDDMTYSVTPQFLLSILFRLIRLELEGQQNIELEKVFIAVPAWYTSCCREQIKDAVQIAGFNDNQIHVINENVCLAFSFLKDDYKKSEFNAVVVSENSGIQDTSVFLVDKRTPKMEILGYFGMKEIEKGVPAQSIITRPFSIFRKKKNDEMEQQMRDAIQEANQASGSQRPTIIEKDILNLASNGNYWVFEGTTYLYAFSVNNNTMSIESVLETVTSVKVFTVSSDDNLKEKKMCRKFGKQTYALKGKITKTTNYNFYQQLEGSKDRFAFGTLIIKRGAQKNMSIEVTLEMSPDGVIILQEVKLEDILLDDTAYSWESHLLKDKHRLEYEQILSKIYHKNTVLEKHVEEHPTEQFFQEVQEAFESGQGLQLSNIAKTLVSKELGEIKCVLINNKGQSNTTELQSVQQRLKTINDMYKLTGL